MADRENESKEKSHSSDNSDTSYATTEARRVGELNEHRKVYPVLIGLSSNVSTYMRIVANRESTVGRHHTCDIVVDSSTISRTHARIYYENYDEPYEEPELTIEDAGSKNGILLNRKRVDGRMALKNRDTIRMGDVVLGLFVRDQYEIQAQNKAYSSSGIRIVVPRAVRVEKTLPVEVEIKKFDESGSTIKFEAETIDLSLDGTGIISREVTTEQFEALLLGRKVAIVRLRLPEHTHPLSIMGRVAWLSHDRGKGDRACRMGVNFVEVPLETQRILRTMLFPTGDIPPPTFE